MTRPAAALLAMAALALGAAATASPAAAAPSARAAQATEAPAVPPTTPARSPFTADRASSEPLGLFPNGTADPFTYPEEPVVLSWSPVPGALRYRVEISTSPGFTQVIWRTVTDQIQVAPEVLLPDGTYWWRVTAVDAAGTRGVTSDVATFAKEWPSRVGGGVLSAAPGGPAVSLVRITPYMRWNAVPGAAFYETQIAAADQFATPIFRSENFPVTGMNPGETGVLPDDAYRWRVRALDAAKNPGPWVDMDGFTKAWVAPAIVGPDDGAVVGGVHLRWQPVDGAETYQVQISSQEHVWQGTKLLVNTTTASTGFVPTVKEHIAAPMGFGVHWWRVRPVVNGVYGTWSEPRRFDWQAPGLADRTPTAELVAAADSDSALTPQLTWSPVVGATMYRVDVATDAQFNNIVESASTRTPAWATRLPLQDNQVREGYWWRIIWGSGSSDTTPDWMVSESAAPRGQFRKQTRVTLGSAASGVVSEPPLFTWSDVPGASRYELQLSRDEEFAAARTQSMTVFGLGTEWSKDEGKRLPSGSWYWRVRAIDATGTGQTWSPVGRFTLNPPRPAVAAPNDGAVVVGSPLLRWAPINAACGYQVQVADNPSFQTSGGDEGDGAQGGAVTPGAPTGTAPEADGAIVTPQAALIPGGKVVSRPGLWHWRVRAAFCADGDYGPWSPTRNFRSVRPPQFNLNALPSTVDYGRTVVVAGRLVHNGRGVERPTLVLERRTWPAADFSAYGTVRGDRAGRFAFSLRVDRSATWRLRWARTASHPEGIAPFVMRARPRIAFQVARSRAPRRSRVVVSGSVFPRRRALIQVRTSDGWRTLRTLPGGRPRFRVALRATMEPGAQRLRLFVPQDRGRRLEAAGSRHRPLFVFDRFVIRRGR